MPCYQFAQTEGTLFVLNLHDEEPRCQRDMCGRRKQGAIFAHGVATPIDNDYFSVAFVFRCLETTAVVDRTADRVIPPPALTKAETKQRCKMAAIRNQDCKDNSILNKQVKEAQAE